ncbi:MAG: hypothetical protein JHC61_11505 [Burkholderiaceae bacterium]|nr:hypothetical protein [Burkholderiaceae bacterium]
MLSLVMNPEAQCTARPPACQSRATNAGHGFIPSRQGWILLFTSGVIQGLVSRMHGGGWYAWSPDVFQLQRPTAVG